MGNVRGLVRKDEQVIHEFELPENLAAGDVFAYRVSKFQNVPYLVVRSTSVAAINSDAAKRTADEAKKTVSQFSTSGLEAVNAAFPLDPKTEEVLESTNYDGKGGLLYERRYRINVDLTGSWQ